MARKSGKDRGIVEKPTGSGKWWVRLIINGRENGSVPPIRAKRKRFMVDSRPRRVKKPTSQRSIRRRNRSRYERGLLAILRVVRIEASPIHDGMAGFGHCCWGIEPCGTSLRKTYAGFRHN